MRTMGVPVSPVPARMATGAAESRLAPWNCRVASMEVGAMSTPQSRRLGMGPTGVSGTPHTDWDSMANGADQSFFIPRS